MRSQELITLMNEPNLVKETDVSLLKEMVATYPYASVFHLLLAKGMHNLGDLSLDEKLKRAAIVAPNRGLLYDLIYAKNMQTIIDKVELSLEEEITIPQKEVVEEPIDDSNKSKKINKVAVNDELQQGILMEAINTTIQLDVDELLKEDRFNVEVKEAQDQSDKTVQTEDVTAFKTPLKFSDWLISMKSVDDKVIETETKPLASAQDLIDNFIANKSKRIDVTKEPLTPKELGRLSLVENEDFVTETLAGIYAKQGKFAKAIKIYEQLMLNFPEKSTFFASRIRFLREKMEYDNN